MLISLQVCIARFLDFSIVISILFLLANCFSAILLFLIRSSGRVRQGYLVFVKKFIPPVSFRRYMGRKDHASRNMNLLSMNFKRKEKQKKNKIFRYRWLRQLNLVPVIPLTRPEISYFIISSGICSNLRNLKFSIFLIIG